MHTHLPSAAEGGVIWNVRWIERFILLQEMDKDPVDLMSGMNSSLDLTLAALDGVEEGVAKVGAVKGEVVAQKVKGVAEEGSALLGHLAMDDHVAADVEGRIHPGFGPDLIGEEKVVNVADTGEIAGNEMGTGARNGHKMASTSSGKQQF